MATNTDKDLVTPTNPAVVDSSLEDVAMYPCPDFDVTPWQSDSAILIPADLTHLPHIFNPPGLDSDLISAAARSVAQLRGSDFIDQSVLVRADAATRNSSVCHSQSFTSGPH